MKSKFEWEFIGCVPISSGSYRFTWRTYGSPQYTIYGALRSDGSSAFDVYQGNKLVEHGWSTLRRAQKFVDRYDRFGPHAHVWEKPRGYSISKPREEV